MVDGPSYMVGDTGVQLIPRQIGGYIGAPAEVIGSGSIASENFVSGSDGWIIRGDGSFELAGGEFRGDLESSNYVLDTTGWFLDWSAGSAEFNGTVTARDLTTGRSGDARVFISDSGATGGSFAGIWFDTGDTEQDIGAAIGGSVAGSGGAEYFSLALFGFQVYDLGFSPALIDLRSESSDGSTSSQAIFLRVDANGSDEGGIRLRDQTTPSNGSLYYGYEYSATQTYMLLSTRVDFWNFEYVRVNTGSDFIVDDDIHVGGAIYFGSTGSGNDRIEYNDTTDAFSFYGDATQAGASIYVDHIYLEGNINFGSDANDVMIFDDTTNIFYLSADGSVTNAIFQAAYFLPEGSGLETTWKRLTGTLSGAGTGTIAHGISSAHQKGLIANAWYKGGSGEMVPLTISSLDGTNVTVTGGTASAGYRVVIMYTSQADRHVW